MSVSLKALSTMCAFAMLTPLAAIGAFDAKLEGQSANSSVWTTSNLRNWRELDLVPVRVLMSGGPASNKTLTIEIDRYKAGIPGIDSLSAFRASSNVVIKSGPTLVAPAGAQTWSYIFTIDLTDNRSGFLEFRARLASGSRDNSGSSLHLYGAPSLGVLQFHKVSPAGTPDLLVAKTAPTTAARGEIITYTLTYSNKLSANSAAGNVQLDDLLPANVSFVPNSATIAPLVNGSTLVWNLGILDPGAYGTISFQAAISGTVTNRHVLENTGTIVSDQSDANTADNIARARTTILFNSAPLAGNDSYSVAEDLVLTVAIPGVLGNDSDPEANALSAVLVTSTTQGALSLLSSGGFVYTPSLNFNGVDQFSYKVTDGTLESAPAQVTITVTPDNDAPVAESDSYRAFEDSHLSIPAPGVLFNDSDVDGPGLQAVLVNNAAHGTVQLLLDGSFSYTPDANFFGSDSFSYRAIDGSANSEPVTVALTVAPVNDAPSFTKGPNQLVQQNSGARTVADWATSITAGPANESAQTLTFIVSNDQPSLFSAQPAISPNGTLTYTPAADKFGAATVTVTLRDNGGRADGGNDTSAAQTFVIRVNAPPTVAITFPTNGTVFMAPAGINIVAEAQDPDGTISKVELLESTNLLAEILELPYLTTWSNVPPGNYQLSARATDDLGASASALPVNISVLDRPPVVTGEMRFNPQTGLFEQPIRVMNPSSFDFSAVCVFVADLPTRYRVRNASGNSNGLPFVQYNSRVRAGDGIDMLIEYYDPLRIMPEPRLFAEAVTPMELPNLTGTELRVTRQSWLPDGTFLLEFRSALGRTYYVQYCDDLVTWKTALPGISGTGTRTQWIDNGPPRTETPPARSNSRLYRVLLMP